MADLPGALDPTQVAEYLVECLGRETECYVGGALIVYNHSGQIVLFCVRPVDSLFLQAVQRRLLLSYQLCVGPALAEPAMRVSIRGATVAGPYETPRSLLTSPLLAGGRVAGMLAIASVFPDAFSSQDLCVMSVLAAQTSEALSSIRTAANGSLPGSASLGAARKKNVLAALRSGSRPAAGPRQLCLSGFSEADVRPPTEKQGVHEVDRCLDSIVELAERCKDPRQEGVPDPLRRDLDRIALHASRVRELLVGHG